MPATARTSPAPHAGNCVAYARAVSGVHLDGNAAQWWPHAEGRYDRGHQPAVGAILVFKPYAGMRVGHVAVVSRIVGPREILIDHANWVRGRVIKAMSVVDSSSNNDWTSVKVLELHSGTHGRDNPTFGFIYPAPPPEWFGLAIAADPDHATRHHAARDEGRHAHEAKSHHRPNPAPLAADKPEIRHAAHHPGRANDEQVVAVY